MNSAPNLQFQGLVVCQYPYDNQSQGGRLILIKISKSKMYMYYSPLKNLISSRKECLKLALSFYSLSDSCILITTRKLILIKVGIFNGF